MTLRVFVAGPFLSNPERNTALAVQAGNRLKKAGFFPFVPHVQGKAMNEVAPMPESVWREWALAWVPVCDAVLRLPGKSEGADREVATARHIGIPVYHSIAEIEEP